MILKVALFFGLIFSISVYSFECNEQQVKKHLLNINGIPRITLLTTIEISKENSLVFILKININL